MNRAESKYFNTAERMNKAFLELLEHKNFEYITVKEICEKASVNRSTFYLHYDTIEELLAETAEYITSKFSEYFPKNAINEFDNIHEISPKSLFLITPQYLTPYLLFFKENALLFRVVSKYPNLLRQLSFFDKIMGKVITPILDRYHIPKNDREYVLSFHLEGITAIIKRWLLNDCREPIEEIVRIITECVKQP